MLTNQQRDMLAVAVQALKAAGISAWFEARIIKDSSKKLNGRRISSLKRTDLESVLAVVDRKRVGMLPNMRMELRMYATAASSRAVFMGQELEYTGRRKVSMSKDPTQAPHTAVVEFPVIGSIQEPVYLEGRAHYSPAKNVERLIAEGAPEALIRHAQDRHKPVPPAKSRVYNVPVPPGISGSTIITEIGGKRVYNADNHFPPPAPKHTHDTLGPMHQKDGDGPFLSTCSLCGDFSS